MDYPGLKTQLWYLEKTRFKLNVLLYFSMEQVQKCFGPTFFKCFAPMFGPTFFKGCLKVGNVPDKLHDAFRCAIPVVSVIQSAIQCWATKIRLDDTAIKAVNIPIINTAQGHFILR